MKKKIILAVLSIAAIIAIGYGVYVERETLIKKEPTLSPISKEKEIVKPTPKEKKPEEPKKLEIDEKAYNDAMNKAFNYKSAGDAGDAKSYYKAIEQYKKAADISHSTVWMPFLNMGNTYRLVKDYANAEKAYDKALSIESGDATIYLAKLELYRYEMKKPVEQVKGLYDHAIATVLANGNLVVGYAGYLEEVGDYPSALKWYKVLYEKYPERSIYSNKIKELEEKIGK